MDTNPEKKAPPPPAADKKALPCSCGSGRQAYRCCSTTRTRASSPEGAFELLCFLRNKGQGYLKTELEDYTGLSRYNIDSIVKWAGCRHMILTVRHDDGWDRYSADKDAMEKWMQSVGEGAPAPRAHAKRMRTGRRPRRIRRRVRSSGVAA